MFTYLMEQKRERESGRERENEEKKRRQVVVRVHKWLIKPRFLLVTVVKQF